MQIRRVLFSAILAVDVPFQFWAQTPTITSGSNLGVFSIGEPQIALTATRRFGALHLDGERHTAPRACTTYGSCRRSSQPAQPPESSALLPRPALIIFP